MSPGEAGWWGQTTSTKGTDWRTTEATLPMELVRNTSRHSSFLKESYVVQKDVSVLFTNSSSSDSDPDMSRAIMEAMK